MTELGEKTRIPEPPFNKVLTQTLRSVDSVLRKKGNSPLRPTQNGIELVNDGGTLVTVTAADIVVAGQSFQDRLVSAPPIDEVSDADQRLARFLDEISDGLVRLNHLGVSYFCGDINKETQRLEDLAQNAQIPLHEEINTEQSQRWLFMGDTDNWEYPLFEMVLNEGEQVRGDFWRPHFQIDIDTSLNLDQIKKATDQHLGEGFIKWQLDIPDYGTVLAMGVLGQVGDTKIVLGIGTDKRGTEEHRRNELKPL